VLNDRFEDRGAASDEVLAESSRRGSGAAFGRLVERHGNAVHAIAWSLCSSSSDVADVVKETFLSAWRGLASLPASSTFRAWLYAIALRTALQRTRRTASISLEGLLPRFDETGRLGAPGGEWAELDRVEVTGVLREALECMDDDLRSAFVLCDVVDLPAAEAAAILEIPAAAVRQRVHRVRLMLRGFLDRLWFPTLNGSSTTAISR
jgi:RNA polymerase sigma-70 factor (ECF subfamily)